MGTNYIYINDLGASDELWCKIIVREVALHTMYYYK